MPSPNLPPLALSSLEVPSAERLAEPSHRQPSAMEAASYSHSDEGIGFQDDFATEFLHCPGAGTSFQAALQSVAAEHGREVQKMQMKMAELRELVTHLQWRSVSQEVKSTNVEVSAVDGSPLVVETVMADGRTFMTMEPPELDVDDPGGFGTPMNTSSDDDSAGSPGNHVAGNARTMNQNGRASLCSSQASSIQVRRPTKERPGDRPKGRSHRHDPWEDGQTSDGDNDVTTPRIRDLIPPLPPESVNHMLAPGSCCSTTRSTTEKQIARGKSETGGVENGVENGGNGIKNHNINTDKEQKELLLQSQQKGDDDRNDSPRRHSDGTENGDGKSKSRGQTTLQTCNSEGLRLRTSNRLQKELLEYQTNGQRLWRQRQSVKRSYQSIAGGPRSALNLLRSEGGLEKIVHHWSFDFFCGVVIVINTVLIGLSTDHVALNEGQDKTEYEIAGLICNVFFMGELLMRLRVDGMKFFYMDGWRWNWFDTFLVLFSILDAIVLYGFKTDAGAVGQSMKTIKMLRIVRVFRVFRFFTELRILALMILDSFRSLIWAVLMLVIIMYVFAIWFTQDVAGHILKVRQEGGTVDPVLPEYFGHLLTTLSSLFHAMLNGISWIELTRGLGSYNYAMQALFFFYVAFTLLAVLNIITGVFVDNAVQTAHTQREFLVEKQIEQKQKWLQEMKELFQEMDTEGTGSISLSTIQEFLEDARVESYFQALGLEPHDTERLFDHLDDDNSGEVSLDEFLQGCLRLRGQARSIDVYSVMHDVRTLNGRVEELVEKLRGVARLASEHHSKSELIRQSSYSQSQAYKDLSNAALAKQGTITTLPEPVEEDEMPTVIQRSTKPALLADGRGGQRWTG